MASVSNPSPKNVDVNSKAAEKIREEIAQLNLQNAALLSELKRQNEYDAAQGRTTGNFREHFTLSCVEANEKSIQQLEHSLRKLGGPPKSEESQSILGFLLSPFANLLSKSERKIGRSNTLPSSFSSDHATGDQSNSQRQRPSSPQLNGSTQQQHASKAPKYSKAAQDKIEKLEEEIERVKSQNVYLLNELKTYEAYGE
jgi:hypothetical protein